MDRRSFLFAAGSACLLPSYSSVAAAPGSEIIGASRIRLQSFDYYGVRLLDSRFRQQMLQARDLYFNMSNDDMLKGFRRKAGLPALGNDMRGWCRHDCGATFGQWTAAWRD